MATFTAFYDANVLYPASPLEPHASGVPPPPQVVVMPPGSAGNDRDAFHCTSRVVEAIFAGEIGGIAVASAIDPRVARVAVES